MSQDLDDLLNEVQTDAEVSEQAYTADRTEAELGRWTPWPKLGPDAELLLARIGNEEYSQLWDQAAKKEGGRKREIPYKKRRELVPTIMAKTIVRGMRGITLRGPEGGDPLSVVEAKKKDANGRLVKQTFTFELLDDGSLKDTLRNRHTLLRLYDPDLGNDIFEYCDEASNFRGGVDRGEAAGN